MTSVVGIGDIWLETNIGCKLLFKDVRYVPDISPIFDLYRYS
jgi:hypothetical protein